MAIVGIDLGTTNSLVAVPGGDPEIVAAPDRLVPSVVRITPMGDVFAGEIAKREAIRDPIHTISGIKRFIGRRYSEVADLADFVAYNVVPGADDYACVHVAGREWRPEEISAEVLKLLKAAAERHLNTEVDRAVITIPAYFNYEQANATRRAAELAGLHCERLVAEPTAAAFAYTKRIGEREARILVVDLGGGTYDVSLVELGGGVAVVSAVDGDGYLGGDDFDSVLFEWAAEEVRDQWKEDLSYNPEARQRLYEAVVEAKCDLSLRKSTTVHIPYLFEGVGGWESVSFDITRGLFESLAEELFQRLVLPIQRVLGDHRYGPLNEVLLVGGATRMPRLAQIVGETTRMKPQRTLNPDEAVALGAGIQAGVLSGLPSTKDIVLLDVTAHAISIETEGNGVCPIIEANTTIPIRKEEIFAPATQDETSVEVNVLLGREPRATLNRLVGTLVIEGLKPPIGQVVVSVDIDADHSLRITVRHLGSGRTETLQTYV